MLNAACLHIQNRKKLLANKRKKPLILSDNRKELIPILDKVKCKWRALSCPMSQAAASEVSADSEPPEKLPILGIPFVITQQHLLALKGPQRA